MDNGFIEKARRDYDNAVAILPGLHHALSNRSVQLRYSHPHQSSDITNDGLIIAK